MLLQQIFGAFPYLRLIFSAFSVGKKPCRIPFGKSIHKQPISNSQTSGQIGRAAERLATLLSCYERCIPGIGSITII
jgi:hypothetical protein